MGTKKGLTAEEILKMSDDDYMNDEQLEFFRRRLSDMERELRANADQTTVNLLKKVQAAIKRIDDGDYGYCEETGDPIGVARLMARPTATLSLEAQQRRELKQKMYGD